MKKKKEIPFSPPRIDDRIVREVESVLRSQWITTGPKTREFEIELARYFGVNHIVCVNSGTMAMELALRWYGIGPGDEVLVPAYTYAATANAVIHTGAKPVMVDSKADDYNISVDDMVTKISEHTKAVIPVDIGGMPCDYDEIMQVVERPDVLKKFKPSHPSQEELGRMLVLEDAAHSLGATHGGVKIGTIADITALSFHAVKNLTTSEGGAIVLNMPDPISREADSWLHIMGLHGQTKSALSKLYGQWKYDIAFPGYKANLPDLLAVIGLVELERYENDTLIKRRQLFDYYTERLTANSGLILPVGQTEQKCPSFHLYMVRLQNAGEPDRDRLIEEAHKMGVMMNVHFIPLPLFSAYKKLGYRIVDYPNAYSLYSNEVSLPLFYDLSFDDIDYIADVIQNII